MVAFIVAGALALTVAVSAAVWAVVAASSPSPAPAADDGPGETIADSTPYFRADQLVEFFLDGARIDEVAGRSLSMQSGGTWFRSGFFDVRPRECAAVFGLVDGNPAGAREQADVGRDAEDRSTGSFYQSVYQFVPADDASARFDEIVRNLETCGKIDIGGEGNFAEVLDSTVELGDVSTAAAEVLLVYGMDSERFIIVATQTANVISVSVLWQRYGSEPGPADSRTMLANAMTEQATVALREWSDDPAPQADVPAATVTAPPQEAPPPPSAPQFTDINGTWCYWTDQTLCFTIDLPNVGDDSVIVRPMAGDYYPPSGDGWTYLVPDEPCFTASAGSPDGDVFGSAVLTYCPSGVSSPVAGPPNYNNEQFDRVYISQEGARDPYFRQSEWAAAIGR